MGRHTKFWERIGWQETPTGETAVAGRPARLAWLGRTPLMPLLAGIVAVGVIAAAFSTRQISLNFAGSSPHDPGSAACAGCDSLSELPPSNQVPVAPAVSPPSQAARTARRPPLTAEFKLTGMVSGGFTGVAVIRNTGQKTVKLWRLVFRIPNAAVVAAQGATLRTAKANGATALLTGIAALAPGQVAKVRFTANGAWSKPAVCRINGKKCP